MHVNGGGITPKEWRINSWEMKIYFSFNVENIDKYKVHKQLYSTSEVLKEVILKKGQNDA